jgi:thymidylate kinase
VTTFWTVLGADYAGKSTVLRTLARDRSWRLVSYDDPYVRGHRVVRQLRSSAFFEAYQQIGRPYSRDLVFSLLTPVALYLRDEAVRQAALGPTVVDSYYYKLLAKGTVTGIAREPATSLWRSLPRSGGVVFLDVDPEVAWRRAGGPGNLNPFEYHGPAPTFEGFARFQAELRAAMLREVAGLPVVMVDANARPDRVAAEVRAALTEVWTPRDAAAAGYRAAVVAGRRG